MGWIAPVIFGALLGWLAAPMEAATPRLCSGGSGNGRVCVTDSDCPKGHCVAARAVCDGGGDDRFDCACPGGSCTRATACPSDGDLGTCVGGARAGECCDPFVGACNDDAACVATAKICLAGPEKAFGCLRDAHCPEGSCAATGAVCRGGIRPDAPCVDAADCPNGTCQPPVPSCVGDCGGDGSVTVDELLAMVSEALGSVAAGTCPAGDGDVDGQITVDEIITAVGHSLSGCPAQP